MVVQTVSQSCQFSLFFMNLLMFQSSGTGALELGILHGAGVQIKNQESELKLNIRSQSSV